MYFRETRAYECLVASAVFMPCWRIANLAGSLTADACKVSGSMKQYFADKEGNKDTSKLIWRAKYCKPT
jgi:hypothetical protein